MSWGPGGGEPKPIPLPEKGKFGFPHWSPDGKRFAVLNTTNSGIELWLCDIAALTETVGSGFDWQACLTTDSCAREWMGAALGVAHELVGCRIPEPGLAAKPPSWLTNSILNEWRAPYARRFRAPEFEASAKFLLKKAASYWPNPIEGALKRGAAPTAARPWRSQAAYFVDNASRGLGKSMRKIFLQA